MKKVILTIMLSIGSASLAQNNWEQLVEFISVDVKFKNDFLLKHSDRLGLEKTYSGENVQINRRFSHSIVEGNTECSISFTKLVSNPIYIKNLEAIKEDQKPIPLTQNRNWKIVKSLAGGTEFSPLFLTLKSEDKELEIICKSLTPVTSARREKTIYAEYHYLLRKNGVDMKKAGYEFHPASSLEDSSHQPQHKVEEIERVAGSSQASQI